MLARLRSRLTYANVMATLGVFIALGGTAYAVNTVNSSDIVDGQVKSVDVGDNEIKSADVKDESLTTFDVSTFLGADVVDNTLTGADIQNGSLKDEDVGKATFVNFAANIQTVGAHQCFSAPITGTGAAEGDHLLLTASGFDSPALATSNLVYSIRYGQGAQPDPKLWFCNPTDGSVPGGITHFSLLVIDAQ